MNLAISPQLAQEIENRIAQLQSDEKYVTNLLSDQNPDGSSSTDESEIEEEKRKGVQVGTSVPKFFGSANTFLINPSNVGLGVIARMIETDPSVQSSVQFKSLMMLSKIGEYQHEDKKIEDFVRGFIKRMKGPTFKESLEAQSSHSGYGFSVSEIVWHLDSQLRKVPLTVKTYHPTTICFEVDQYGDVTPMGVIQFTSQLSQFANPNNYFPNYRGGTRVENPFETPMDRMLPHRMPFISNYGLARIPFSKVIHHKSNAMLNFGSPYGKTAVRTAHLAWQLKVYFQKQMGVAGKRQASPFIWATAPRKGNKDRALLPEGQTKEMTPIAALSDILSRRETDDAVVTGPKDEGYNLEAIAATLDLNQFLEVLNYLDVQIFRSFLLPSLVMTDGSAGSRSLGDKHFQMVDFVAGEEAETFSQNIINQMIRPAIDMNFGEQEDYGHFAQRPQTIDERERLSNMFNALGNTGFLKSYDQKDGEYVRSVLHLPPQDESFYAKQSPNLPQRHPLDDDDGESIPAEKPPVKD